MDELKKLLLGSVGAYFLFVFIRLVAPDLSQPEKFMAYFSLLLGYYFMYKAWGDTI